MPFSNNVTTCRSHRTDAKTETGEGLEDEGPVTAPSLKQGAATADGPETTASLESAGARAVS